MGGVMGGGGGGSGSKLRVQRALPGTCSLDPAGVHEPRALLRQPAGSTDASLRVTATLVSRTYSTYPGSIDIRTVVSKLLTIYSKIVI